MTTKAFVGRLGDVPEVRVTQGGKPVAVFSVAETKRRKNPESGQWEDEFTIWHNVESWRNTNALSHLPKGSLVMVMGEERDASYENREGRKVARVVVRASEVGRLVVDQADMPSAAVEEAWSAPSSGAGEQSWGGAW